MSREVEVTGIKMTATVPEDLQISLGQLTNIKTGATGNPTAAEISVILPSIAIPIEIC